MEIILANALGQDSSQLAVAEKRELLARLLARLAHEIGNPLSSLDVHAQLLEEDLAAVAPDIRARTSPRLEIIQGELHRLKSIVNQFLRLAGPSALDLSPVDIGKTANHVCELLRPEAATRQIAIAAQAEDAIPIIQADSVKLTQALMNLVINAIQAVEHHGRVEISITADEGVCVEIRDTGPGIPPERVASIFDPFYTTKTEGHGLGLWIAQQIVAAHGGVLQASNGPERGAIFRFTLPAHSGV